MSDTRRVPVGLKPCPFCGSSAALAWSDVDGKYRHYFGNCEACGGTGGWARAESRAAEKWNTRAAAPPDDELARLEREIATDHATQKVIGFRNDFPEYVWNGWLWREQGAEFWPKLEYYLRYFELRGLLERHPDNPNLVRIKESE